MTAEPAASTASQRRVLWSVTAAQTLNVASTTVIAVALPDIGRTLGADGTEQQWIVDAFVLVFASLLVAGGAVGDRHGRRIAFIGGLVLFTLGSLACALAPSSDALIAGRVLQALGPPLVLPASLAIVSNTYPDRVMKARAIGFWAIGSGVGLALGPLMGGLLVDSFGWRGVFAVNVPICVALVAVALRSVPRDRPESPPGQPFDVAAAVLMTLAVGTLVFALIEGRNLGWASPEVLGAFAVALTSLALFVRQERRHPNPLIDLELLTRRPFLAANLGGAVMYGALMGSAVYVAIFLQQVQDRSALEAGLCLLPQGACTAIAAPIAARWTGRAGSSRTPILIGMATTTVAFVLLLQLEPSTPLAFVWLAFGMLGCGIGIALPPMTVTALASAPPEKAGMASAIHNTSRQLGQTFGVAVLGTLIFTAAGDDVASGTVTAAGTEGFVDGLHLAFLASACLVAIAAAAVAVLVPQERTTAPR